jgi:hypothetical protein
MRNKHPNEGSCFFTIFIKLNIILFMDENILNRIENYDKALASVNELLTYPNVDGVVKTGFVQRFNLAFEIAIKLLK